MLHRFKWHQYRYRHLYCLQASQFQLLVHWQLWSTPPVETTHTHCHYNTQCHEALSNFNTRHCNTRPLRSPPAHSHQRLTAPLRGLQRTARPPPVQEQGRGKLCSDTLTLITPQHLSLEGSGVCVCRKQDLTPMAKSRYY